MTVAQVRRCHSLGPTLIRTASLLRATLALWTTTSDCTCLAARRRPNTFLSRLQSCSAGTRNGPPREHPAVSSSSVIGIEAFVEEGLHCPRAFVVPTQSYYSSARNGTEKSSSPRGEQGPVCSLLAELRRLLAEELLDFVNKRVSWERQLTGSIAIIDEIPALHIGKIDKSRLRQFGPDQVEIFGNKCEK